ncbi:MAG: antibiotic biosynthesis monooxygenase [Opitutaceae bacterium]|nr:antibiotic biosynthesis monooxygenase [Opitutaceae bacterium]
MPATLEKDPITVVAHRRVKPGCESAFETAMREFTTFALEQPGNLGLHVLRPSPPESRDYTVVARFADAEARRSFKATSEYAAWMRHLREFCEQDPYIEEMSGLAGWFTLPDRPHKAPPRWKMAAVTFLGVYPLAALIPPVAKRAFPDWPPLLLNVPINLVVVASLAWVVMPILTRIFARWLFGRS